MRQNRRVWQWLCLCCCYLIAACDQNTPSAVVQADAGQAVYEYQLDNGLKILVRPDQRAPVVVSQVWYKVGSSYEYNGITGISHMLEHMMFKGTQQLKPGEFSEIIALHGGRENAFTSRDYTAYFQTISHEHLELCLRLEADRMRNIVFDPEEFVKERAVVAEERRLRYEDRPQSLTYEQFTAAAYVNSPYHHPVIGWMEDIQAYTVTDAQRWYQTWYAPNNATLVVVGDVDPDEVFTLAKRYFGPLRPATITPPKPQREVVQRGQRRVQVHGPTKVPYLLLGYKAPVLKTIDDSAEVYALEVLAGILSGGDSARLNRRLVRGQQIAASASASYNPYSRLQSLFTLAAVPATGVSVADLEAALIAELQDLQTELVSDAELERVKAQVVAADVYQKDSMFYQAMALGILTTVGLDWRLIDDYVPGVQRVTAEQLRAVARRYFQPEQLTVAELVPESVAKTLAGSDER